ncbi:cytochrome P450 [Frankia sp. CNm7]|uniref:Cytochrome P450 n=1 Tax=Frankia nepalensis TaxID=1836974 RepID=A0A937UQ15_9ACTN|nr:cytochrome P450 [Frankia nepalensis]MBL7498791.1 cytochrome P450 [Frankia nepalensis]MBL7508596.1 cytochrome P450 [Frankia nepalensis]MBL7517486.1 cytochrome P450 [Frankia nepalensis]MBL7629732.1 cytochrome P450 [Frankia nepalensis]
MTGLPAVQDPLAAFAPDNRADPYSGYRRVAAGPRLQTLAPSILLAPRFRECEAVLQDAAWGHGYAESLNPFRPGVPVAEVPGSILILDPPDHTRLRSVVSRAFTARAMTRLRARVTADAERMVNAMIEAGEAEVMSELAENLALHTSSALMGIPVSEAMGLRGPLRMMARGVDPDLFLSATEVAQRVEGRKTVEEYFGALLAARLDGRAPQADDVLGTVAETAAGGELTHELVELASVMFVGGHGTTESVLGNSVLSLARDPEQFDRIRAAPELVPSAVEELIRFEPPVQFTHRVALSERTLDGHQLPRGTGVVIMIASANRDPDVYTDPDQLDLGRYHGASPARRHLAFSLGTHYCIGAILGKMQLEAVLVALTRGCKALETVGEPVYHPNVAIRSMSALPVRFHRA